MSVASRSLGVLGVDLDLDRGPCFCDLGDAEEGSSREGEEGCLELGWGLASSWLSWLMSWLSRLGFQWLGWTGLAGWLAAGLKSIGRDLWGERERVRRRGRRGGKGTAAVWLVAVQGTERTNEQDGRGDRPHTHRERERTRHTTEHDTAGTGRKRGTIDRLTGEHALAGGTDLAADWKARPAKEQKRSGHGWVQAQNPPGPPRA